MPVYVVNFRKRRNKLRKKKNAQKEHFKNKILERFGVVCTEKLRDSVTRAIREGTGTQVEKKSNRISFWKDVVPGHPEIIVVYDKYRHQPVSALKEILDDK